MSAGSFNLLDEPWIVARGLDRTERELSIMDVFEQSPRLATLEGDVPTQSFAITRLLLAFLHRALDGPDDQDEWVELWSRSELPLETIRSYAERVRHRFDLFDSERPFFQVADLRSTGGDVSSLAKIVADVPNGEPLFTTRSAASLRRIEPSEAARWLVHTHAFDPSGIKTGAADDPKAKNGKGYPIGTGWCGQIGGILALGPTVRDTLLLNLIAREASEYVHIGGSRDLPPWELEPDTAMWQEERPPRGAIDLYTWQSRRVRLVGDRTGVTGVVLANGDKIQPQNQCRYEPHTSWRHSEAQGRKYKTVVYMPNTHDSGRSVWRGIAALLPSASPHDGRGDQPQRYVAPGVLLWLNALAANDNMADDYPFQLRVHGAEYGSQSATFAEIIDDTLPLSVALLRQDRPQAGRTAEEAADDVRQAAKHVWRFAENIAQACGAEPRSGAGDRASEALYSALERPYRSWLATITPSRDLSGARAEWREMVRAALRPITAELIDSAPSAAWSGRTVNNQLINVPLAESWFNAALRRILPDAAPDTSTEVSA